MTTPRTGRTTHPIVSKIDYEATAAAHRDADRYCGREWSCQCGACRIVRGDTEAK